MFVCLVLTAKEATTYSCAEILNLNGKSGNVETDFRTTNSIYCIQTWKDCRTKFANRKCCKNKFALQNLISRAEARKHEFVCLYVMDAPLCNVLFIIIILAMPPIAAPLFFTGIIRQP